MIGTIPTSPSPSRMNPGTYLYVDGEYFKLCAETSQEIFDGIHRALTVMEQVGFLFPGSDWGIVTVDAAGNQSFTTLPF